MSKRESGGRGRKTKPTYTHHGKDLHKQEVRAQETGSSPQDVVNAFCGANSSGSKLLLFVPHKALTSPPVFTIASAITRYAMASSPRMQPYSALVINKLTLYFAN